MNGPRKKGPVELQWSAIKRAVTARVSYDAQVWRERELNRRLDEAFKEFKRAIDRGELVDASDELEALGPGKTP